MILIAVDPGVDGGIAWKNGDLACAENMPDTESDIRALFREIMNEQECRLSTTAYVENVPIAMPGRGAAMAKLNSNAGFIRGLLCGLGIRTILIRPVKWQEFYEFGSKPKKRGKDGEMKPDDTAWKNRLKAESQRRFPHLKVTLKTADALLLLDYAIAKEK